MSRARYSSNVKLGVRVLPDADLLDPSHGVEAPRLQVGRHRFADPLDGVVAVFLFPTSQVLRIAQRGGVDVIEPGRESRFSVRSEEDPTLTPLAEGEVSPRGMAVSLEPVPAWRRRPPCCRREKRHVRP